MIYVAAFLIALLGAAGIWTVMYCGFWVWDAHCEKHPDSAACYEDL